METTRVTRAQRRHLHGKIQELAKDHREAKAVCRDAEEAVRSRIAQIGYLQRYDPILDVLGQTRRIARGRAKDAFQVLRSAKRLYRLSYESEMGAVAFHFLDTVRQRVLFVQGHMKNLDNVRYSVGQTIPWPCADMPGIFRTRIIGILNSFDVNAVETRDCKGLEFTVTGFGLHGVNLWA